MFSSILGLVGDVVKIAATPIEIAVDLTRAVTKPIAEFAEEFKDDIKLDLE